MNKLILVVGLALAYKAYEAFKTIDNETDYKNEPKLSKQEISEKILESIKNVNVNKDIEIKEIKEKLSVLQKEIAILHELELKNEQLSALGGIKVGEIKFNGLEIKEARKIREDELNNLFRLLKELEKNAFENFSQSRKKEEKRKDFRENRIFKLTDSLEEVFGGNSFVSLKPTNRKGESYSLEEFIKVFGKNNKV